jgi:hypothetical protein
MTSEEETARRALACEKIAEALQLIGFIGAELHEPTPDHIVVSTLSLAARTALRHVTDQYGAALEFHT